MNLDLTPEDLTFRDEVRAFLDANLTPALRQAGRRATSVFMERDYSLAWQKILHTRGWVAPSWPVQYGGPGWGDMQRYIFAAECSRAGAPSLSPMGLRMVGPVIMGYGSPEQKAFFLPRILAGEDYWCQGYSEPGAGSDLAALQLAAARSAIAPRRLYWAPPKGAADRLGEDASCLKIGLEPDPGSGLIGGRVQWRRQLG